MSKLSVFGVFWSTLSHIWSKYKEILRIAPYSVQMRENRDQKNSEYENFLRNEFFLYCLYYVSRLYWKVTIYQSIRIYIIHMSNRYICNYYNNWENIVIWSDLVLQCDHYNTTVITYFSPFQLDIILVDILVKTEEMMINVTGNFYIYFLKWRCITSCSCGKRIKFNATLLLWI